MTMKCITESGEQNVSDSQSEITVVASTVKRTWSNGNYPKLSTLMGSWPEMAIFRRFGPLNVQNLLFLQAELSHLEDELRRLREEHSGSEDEKRQLSLRCWWDMRGDEDSEQLDIVTEIRGKLSEYNAALLQYKELCQLHSPLKSDLECLRQWLIRPKCGENFLRGIESEVWDADRPHTDYDLVTMSAVHVEQDAFSKWLNSDVAEWFHRVAGERMTKPWDEESGMYHYKNSRYRFISHLFGVLFASLIPATSIFTLYYLRSMVARLGTLLAFSVVFSISLAIFTTAKKAEIFAATAAFASVQVVFVGSTGGP